MTGFYNIYKNFAYSEKWEKEQDIGIYMCKTCFSIKKVNK